MWFAIMLRNSLMFKRPLHRHAVEAFGKRSIGAAIASSKALGVGFSMHGNGKDKTSSKQRYCHKPVVLEGCRTGSPEGPCYGTPRRGWRRRGRIQNSKTLLLVWECKTDSGLHPNNLAAPAQSVSALEKRKASPAQSVKYLSGGAC